MRDQPDYEWLEHTADIRVRVRGESEEDLYASAALTMFALMIETPGEDESDGDIDVVVERSNVHDRLIDLLRELLFRFDVDGDLLLSARAELDGERVALKGRRVAFDPERHEGLREIKAITYHLLDVGQDEQGWWAEIVFDV